MSEAPQDWPAGRPLIWGFLTLAVLIIGLGGWSVLTTLSGAVIAQGQIEVTQSRQVVQHPDGGVVQALFVGEGDKVRSGDILLRLDGSQLRSDLAIVESQRLEAAARRARLAAERDAAGEIAFPPDLLLAAKNRPDIAELVEGQQGLFAAHRETLAQATDQRRARIEQIANQISGIDVEQAALDHQIRSLAADLVTQQDLLAAGLTEASQVSALDREIARLKGRRGELAAAKAAAADRVVEIEIEISALATHMREAAETELRDIVARETELTERQHALEIRIARLDVRAPSAGIVLGLQTTTLQSVIRPADILMYIVPQDRPLLVAARVPVANVDEVTIGQEVRLVFSALSSRHTPELTGDVGLISADALVDERTGQSYYRAEIFIDPSSLLDLQELALLPGMPVEAFIRTEERTPLSYFLRPFTEYFRRAMRES